MAQEKVAMLERFAGECELLSGLHHPCIVQFLGVCFEQGSPLPVLVMEYLHTTLSACLERYGVLPKEITYGILRDVALGLCYLHELSPPIIHRDLSANNVLLTSSMNAKLSDLGVAKILNLTPARMTQMTQTKAPGTPCYMPPEALTAKPKYTSKIDIYSYGVLTIHTLCGRWPFPEDVFRPDPRNPDAMIPVSEVERRAEYLQEIGNDHPLMGLIRQCLSNMPTRRPEAPALLERVNAILSTLPQPFTNRVEIIQQLQTITDEKNSLQSEIDSLTTEIKRNQSKMDSLRVEVETLTDVKKSMQSEIDSFTTETRQKKSEIDSLRVEVETLSVQNPSQQAHSQPSHTGQPDTQNQDPIMSHEERALNFVVHEYLMQRDNKLTAITFTEENVDQDFDDWDDVGLNIPKPPDLLYLFRNYSTCALSDKEKIDRIKQLEDQLSTVTGENLALKRENEALQLRLKRVSISSGGSSRSEGGYKKTHRRGGSLSERQKDMTDTVSELKRKTHTRNRSSPEADLTQIIAAAKEAEGLDRSKQAECMGKGSKVNERKGSEGSDVCDEKSREFNRSTTSSTSVISDVTLSADDDADTVIDEGERPKEWEEKERSDTLKREQSISSTTLQNDKQDGEEEEGRDKPDGQKGREAKIEPRLHQMSVTFRQELLNIFHLKTESRIGLEVAKLTDPNVDLVQLLGRCLPHIVPNVILAKRDELIPILLCVISKHPDSKTRDQLLNMMFNLIKRPDKKQRHVIMSGCVAYAKLSGTTRVESELLPQMWEQITHKYYERRLLVAESCGVMAPYIPAELRGSLVLSMLKQMLMEDKAESVRQAVAHSLAIIVAFTDDEDKFKQCWELMLKALTDPSQLVVSTTYSVLLPALAAWSFELNTLESDILSYFLHQLLTCIKQVSRSDGESGAVEQSQHHLLTLTHLVSWHYATILLSGPYVDNLSVDLEGLEVPSFPHPTSPLLDIRVIIGDNAKLSTLVRMFELEVESKSFTPWKTLQWLKEEYLEKLLRASVVLGFSQSELIHSLSLLLAAYCTYFGHTFTHKVIKPFFEKQLMLPKHNPGSAIADGHTHLTTPVLPVYISGVLAVFDKDEKLVVTYLRCTIVDMALYFAPLDSLKATFKELRRERRYHNLLLGLLQDLVTHSSFQVRRYIAILFGLMIRNVDEKLVMKVVLPNLIKLAKDPEMSVRIDTIESFGTIMATVTRKEILVRAHEQFEAFMDQQQFRVDHQVLMVVLKTLAKIGPHADPVFRDEFIIMRLAEVAIENSKADNLTKRKDIALALLEAYRNISECFISTELLTTYMLPGLHSVLKDMETLEKDQVPAVQQLIRNCRSKVEEYQKQATGSSEAAVTGDSKTSTFISKLIPPFDRDISISPSKLFKKKS